MKSWNRRIGIVLIFAVMCVTFTACASVKSDKAYAVEVDGTEIIVGATTVSTLFDAGYEIMALDGSSSFDLEASYPLEKDSYYTGLFLEKDDKTIAMLHIATENKDVTASEAIIATMIFSSYDDEPLNTDMIKFDGVTLTDLTTEVFMEHVPGGTVYEDASSAYFHGTNYGVNVEYEDGVPVELEVECKYDVEW